MNEMLNNGGNSSSNDQNKGDGSNLGRKSNLQNFKEIFDKKKENFEAHKKRNSVYYRWDKPTPNHQKKPDNSKSSIRADITNKLKGAVLDNLSKKFMEINSIDITKYNLPPDEI